VVRGPTDYSGAIELLMNENSISVNVYRGVGSVVRVFDEAILSLEVSGGSPIHEVHGSNLPTRQLSGILSGDDLVWDAKAIIFIEETVEIPGGAILSVAAGTHVQLAPNVRIEVSGELDIDGTEEKPVVFAPASEDAWGGLHLAPKSSANAAHAWWIGGGGDPSRAFGHSQSQPIIRVEEATFSALGGGALDSPGKAFGASDSRVTLQSFLTSRCDTGGEFERSRLVVMGSHFLEIPDADGLLEDDDNDALYLVDVLLEDGEPLESRITTSVFALGEDDAIDQNGARVAIQRSWITGFAHEGVAASNGERISIRNTLIENCDQGIEAGYGSPEVIVDNCVVVHNNHGLRMGDEYDWEVNGTLTVTNTVSVSNRVANVKNHVKRLNGPAPGAIQIMCSMVDDPVWDDIEGNLSGIPEWDSNGCLTDDSKGKGAGCDTPDIGKVTCP
jgi:hypothetical protein